jgi:hypothetical protein
MNCGDVLLLVIIVVSLYMVIDRFSTHMVVLIHRRKRTEARHELVLGSARNPRMLGCDLRLFSDWRVGHHVAVQVAVLQICKTRAGFRPAFVFKSARLVLRKNLALVRGIRVRGGDELGTKCSVF